MGIFVRSLLIFATGFFGTAITASIDYQTGFDLSNYNNLQIWVHNISQMILGAVIVFIATFKKA